ncbi:hypothetical protein [Streptomyces sp. NPDC086766]|uniref:hypothetical protein n=1 Tax=Streptomyces sp. NPDC086766 TaxID=3365754 RepID=UPI00380B083C
MAHLLLPAPSKPIAEPLTADSAADPYLSVYSAESASIEAPLTSEPPLPDAEPLTSEPPLAETTPLTSETAAEPDPCCAEM